MNERTVFLTALEKEDSAQRKAYLDGACADDAALRARVEGLLQAHEREGNFLNVPAVEQLAAPNSVASPDVTEAETPFEAEDNTDLSFLAPSNKPGSLGRLGHFEIQGVVGCGGMGIVLRAVDETLQRVVALKVMAAPLAVNGTGRQRFAREARAAAAVRDEHVVNIHAVQETGERPYLAMEYIAGQSLQERLDRSGPLAIKEVLRIGMQIARGLAAAHKQGLIHRDIKPSNILLENGVERVKITDFGLARAVDDVSLTQSGVISGTPQYMSPEQARGEATDQRSDLFSLGSVLYAMCAGRPPFRASGTMGVLKRVCEEPARPLSEINPELPGWLAAIIDKLLAKDPAKRYQSAAEVAELLNQCLAHLQQPSVVPLPTAKPVSSSNARRRVVAMFALLFLAAIVVGLTTGRLRFFAPDSDIRPDAPGEERPASGNFTDIWKRTPCWGSEIALTKDGKRAVATDGRFLFTFDPTTGTELERFAGHGHTVRSVAFSPKGEWIASGSQDATVRIWKPGTKSAVRTFATEHIVDGGSGLPFSFLAFSPDGKRLLAASRNDLLMWDFKSGELERRFVGHKGAPRRVVFSSDGKRIASCAHDGTARIWRTESGETLHTLGEGSNWIVDVDFSPDGTLLATGGRVVTLCDVTTGATRWSFPIDFKWAEGVTFTPDGRFLLAGTGTFDPKHEGQLVVIDVLTGKEVHRSGGLHNYIFDLKTTPDGRGVYISESGAMPLRRLPESIWATKSELSPATKRTGPFVLLGSKVVAERRFDTLAEAVQGASDGDTIEIRGNGPFVTKPIVIAQGSLRIRAGEGSCPVIKAHPDEQGDVLLQSQSLLALEGLDLQWVNAKPGGPGRYLVVSDGPAARLHVVNCRFLMNRSEGAHDMGCIGAWDSALCHIRNCQLLVSGSGTFYPVFNVKGCPGSALIVENCLLGEQILLTVTHAKPMNAILSRNTFLGERFMTFRHYKNVDFAGAKPGSGLFEIVTSSNIFGGPLMFVQLHEFLKSGMEFDGKEGEKVLKQMVGWQDHGNLYSSPEGSELLKLWLEKKPNERPSVRLTAPVTTLADWKGFWGLEKLDSTRGQAKYLGGNLATKAKLTPELLTPNDFRLRPDSAGYKAGKDGKDLGADVDLVGPGPAYERWKKTPEYQQWLKDTGHATKAEAARPVLRMHFDKDDFYEKDGQSYVRDRSGKGNDGLCEQVQFTPEGKTGGGLANDGKGFLRLPTSLVANRPHFTIAAWVKRTKLTDGWAVYTCVEKVYPTRYSPAFNFFCTSQLYVGAWNRTTDWLHTSALAAKMTPGEWVFVAVTLENGIPGKGRLQLMLNDRFAERSLQQIGGVPLEGIQDLAALKLEGVFDELAVWDRALTDQELRTLFALGLPGPKD